MTEHLPGAPPVTPLHWLLRLQCVNSGWGDTNILPQHLLLKRNNSSGKRTNPKWSCWWVFFTEWTHRVTSTSEVTPSSQGLTLTPCYSPESPSHSARSFQRLKQNRRVAVANCEPARSPHHCLPLPLLRCLHLLPFAPHPRTVVQNPLRTFTLHSHFSWSDLFLSSWDSFSLSCSYEIIFASN